MITGTYKDSLPAILHCKHCGKSKHKDYFRTLRVCKECRSNQQIERLKSKPGYRDWHDHIASLPIHFLKERTCYICHERKDSSKFKSRKTCQDCYAISQIKYRYKAGTVKHRYVHLRFSAQRRGIEFNLDRELFYEWFNNQKKECIYCNKTFEQVQVSTDRLDIKSKNLSIDRLNNNIGYQIDNIGICCGRCNMIKGNFFTRDEMLKIGKIIKERVFETSSP